MRSRASLVVPGFVPGLLAATLAFACGTANTPSSVDTGQGAESASAGASTTRGAGDASPGGSAAGGVQPSGGDSGASSEGGRTGTPVGGGGGGGAGDAGGGAGVSGGFAGTPSLGCSSKVVPTSGRSTLDVAGTEREYILKLPAAYDVTKPSAYRLILLLHGRMYSAQSVADGGPPGMTGPYYGIEAASDGNAILVAAQALSTSWTNEAGRDVAYIDAMIARFKAELCFDESRIFGVGFSMGAIMTLTAGCEASSVLRAIAPMSASLPTNCSSSGKPLAYWGSHGTNDPTIDISQGEAVRDSFVAKNGCDKTSVPGDRDGCVNYPGCEAGAPVTWCTFSGVHEPPPFAGAGIWAFFSQL